MDNDGLTVLSLFDGMSCGAIALREAGIKVKQYFASEIDKAAIRQTVHNFPDTIQLGDVRNVRVSELPRIDLLIGGSPCQGFSFAGKQLNFNDSRSALFFEYVRILHEIQRYNPPVKFLLENVRMQREYEHIISEHLGLRPVMINSALVSAQNRERLYWSNIRTKSIPNLFFTETYTDIPQPKDRGILLADILEDEVDEKYFVNPDRISNFNELIYELSDGETKCMTLRRRYDPISNRNEQMQNIRCNGQSKAFTSVLKNNQTILSEGNYCIPRIISGVIVSPKFGGGFRPVKSGKGACLMARARNDGCGQNVCMIIKGNCIAVRRLTPAECSRLQTIPDWYEWNCGDTQIYKLLGNGWTVDVIRHILQFL